MELRDKIICNFSKKSLSLLKTLRWFVDVDGGLSEWQQWTKCDKECGNGLRKRERTCDNPEPKGKGKDCSDLGALTEAAQCKIKDCPVNGSYSKWGAYTPCTESCGGGTKRRSRTCDNPKPAHGGKECSEPPIQTAPLNGGYGKWGAYKPCTKSCGGGTKTRSRECNNPRPAHGGKKCEGDSLQSASCNTTPCPINGGYSNWGAYKPCTKSCGGGTKTRSRECNNPRPAHGGKKCEGDPSESTSCNTTPCPINGGYSNWGAYKPCTKSCGGGTKTRSRECNNPRPAHGGKKCEGDSSQSASCNTTPCPINGGYSNWGAYKPCTKSCGGGTKTRSRECNNPRPAHGGKKCEGDSSESASCNTTPCPINGGYSNWGAYKPCTKSCGGGTKTRSRVCNNPRPAHGGKKCEGASSQTVPCNSNPCPVNGGYSNWGAYKSCTKSCGGGTKTRSRVCNNPRPAHGGKNCEGASSQTVQCNSNACPINGGYSNWGAYKPCTKSCGGGTKTRSRVCNNPRPAHGGRNCVGASSHTVPCNSNSCPVNGGYSNWGAYKPCTKPCGGGTKTRNRACNNPKPAHGGRNCVGASSQSIACNTKHCHTQIFTVGHLIKSTWRFESYNYRNYYFRHQNYRVRIDRFIANNKLYDLDSSWFVVAGLCGQGVSFKSENYPTYYLRHRGYMAYIDRFDGSALYRKDACFIPRHGLANSLYVSFESVNYPGYYLRHQNYFLRISRNDGSTLMKKDATWIPRDIRVHGKWSSFGAYGSCSKKCGGGVMYRYRSCTNPKPAHGGRGCSGLTRLSASCNSQQCPAITGCSYYSTTWQTHHGGKMEYIDRHRMGCRGVGKILAMFQLKRSGGNMRYSYKCCHFPAASCTNQQKYTSFSYDGNGNAVYLDRHAADCSTTGFINDMRVQRNSGHNMVRYNYQCCNLSSQLRRYASCYISATGYTFDGNGRVYYLDRQKVECRAGYALSYYKLERNSSHDHWRYRYRCCKVNY
eukprot:Seg4492.1 transcript_id=Seg4492.1/GoldUCD/mRNA.D3Y31 product=Coadhesin protein_id=Seg4492.1/GoldUCD/D3Y31